MFRKKKPKTMEDILKIFDETIVDLRDLEAEKTAQAEANENEAARLAVEATLRRAESIRASGIRSKIEQLVK